MQMAELNAGTKEKAEDPDVAHAVDMEAQQAADDAAPSRPSLPGQKTRQSRLKLPTPAPAAAAAVAREASAPAAAGLDDLPPATIEKEKTPTPTKSKPVRPIMALPGTNEASSTQSSEAASTSALPPAKEAATSESTLKKPGPPGRIGTDEVAGMWINVLSPLFVLFLHASFVEWRPQGRNKLRQYEHGCQVCMPVGLSRSSSAEGALFERKRGTNTFEFNVPDSAPDVWTFSSATTASDGCNYYKRCHALDDIFLKRNNG